MAAPEPLLVRVIDPASAYHNQVVSVGFKDGFVERIETVEPPASGPITHLSAGWCDAQVHLTDPGFEHRDTIASLAASAKAGGFTDIITLPTCEPVVDTAEALLALQQRAEALPVALHFLGACSHRRAGEHMAPLAELHRMGAVGFADSIRGLQSTRLMLRVLEYARLFDGLVVLHPLDWSLAEGGTMNESATSVKLGMPGVPNLAEELYIARVIRLMHYTGGRVHISPVTTAGAVDLIREAKASGLDLTASTAPHYLYFTDEALHGFDTDLKVWPPLRTTTDQQALIAGLLDGTLDFIATHHQPQAVEDKEVEFTAAEPGMLGLETAFRALFKTLVEPGYASLEQLVQWLAFAPRQRFGLPVPTFAVGQAARYTLFQPDAAARPLERADLRSRSRNSPYVGEMLPGAVVGVLCG